MVIAKIFRHSWENRISIKGIIQSLNNHGLYKYYGNSMALPNSDGGDNRAVGRDRMRGGRDNSRDRGAVDFGRHSNDFPNKYQSQNQNAAGSPYQQQISTYSSPITTWFVYGIHVGYLPKSGDMWRLRPRSRPRLHNEKWVT